jgi:protoheme IX farnesyltransferase
VCPSVMALTARLPVGSRTDGDPRSDGPRVAGAAGRSKVAAYVALTKPRIIELLLVTTVPTMVVAERGMPGTWLMVATVLGGTLAAGGANAINMVVDRDIDALMDRTKGRPLVTGELTPRAALTFAIGLEVAAFAFLWATVNLLSAILAVSACLFYVFVYTLWLKRRSEHNIVIGGAAGAVPVLVGWSAVTGSLGWAPVLLFAVIFYWTPPHFWALAIRYRDDYSAASVPMLPSVREAKVVATRILLYTLLLWALTIAFAPVAEMGGIYLASAIVLGGVYTVLAARLRTDASPKQAMRLFGYSITYITLLFGAMAVDTLVRHV